MSFTKYIGTLFIYLAPIFAIGLGLFYYVIPQYYFKAYPFFLIYFLLIGMFFYKIIGNNKNMTQQTFRNWFMANSLLKLFVSFLIVILYALFIKTNLISFVISFLVFYVLLMIIEIYLFISSFKGKKNNVI